MSRTDGADGPPSATGRWFTTTHWSVVLEAKDLSAPAAAEALQQLCLTYWYPLYAHVRRKGLDEEAAKDLTQGFFASLLGRGSLGTVAREKGRFRSFLLTSLNHFLSDEWDKVRAKKRGGGSVLLSLSGETGEERYQLEPVDDMDPERLYERRWALALLEAAHVELEGEWVKLGKGHLFEQIKPYTTGDDSAPPYVELAASLGLTEAGARTAVFRARRRYSELIRQKVAETVADPEQVDEELRHLIQVLS